MFCEQCGGRLSAEARFCAQCGAPVPERATASATTASVPPPPTVAPPPPPPPPGWYAPGTSTYAAPTKTNGFAVTAMVLGLVWVYWIGSILALVFGYIALRQIKRSEGRQTGRGMAIAGVVLGWVGVALLVLVIIVALADSG